MKLFHYFSILCILLSGTSLLGQSAGIKADLTINDREINLGKPITVTVSIKHPEEVIVEFPAGRDFSPFELMSSSPRPTVTESGISYDVVDFHIRTFSLAPKQLLSLPYTWYGARDTGSSKLFSDTLFLHRNIAIVNDSLEYRYSLTPIVLEDPPNYLNILLACFAITLFIVLAGLSLRKPISRFWAMRNLNRQSERVKKSLDRIAIEQNQEIQLESLNSLWRDYLDPKQKRQLGAMTTTELQQGVQGLTYLRIEDQKALLHAARLRDQVSFAGIPISKAEIHTVIESLKKIVDSTYTFRKDQLQSSK